MGISQAEIVTARELGAAERDALLAEIGKLAGARVEASFKLDASILGGTVVRIGSTVYDGSVRGRLDTAEGSIDGGLKPAGVRDQGSGIRIGLASSTKSIQ